MFSDGLRPVAGTGAAESAILAGCDCILLVGPRRGHIVQILWQRNLTYLRLPDGMESKRRLVPTRQRLRQFRFRVIS